MIRRRVETRGVGDGSSRVPNNVIIDDSGGILIPKPPDPPHTRRTSEPPPEEQEHHGKHFWNSLHENKNFTQTLLKIRGEIEILPKKIS